MLVSNQPDVFFSRELSVPSKAIWPSVRGVCGAIRRNREEIDKLLYMSAYNRIKLVRGSNKKREFDGKRGRMCVTDEGEVSKSQHI